MEEENKEWYYNKNCRPLDIHKYSCYPQVTQCIDSLLKNELELTNNNIYKTHLNMLIVDLYHRYIGVKYSGGIGYSRDNNAYKIKTRYNKLKIKRTPLITIIDKLEELEFVDNVKGYKTDKQGFNSKLRATPKLINYIRNYNIDPDAIWSTDLKEIIILKDKNGKKLEYQDTPFTNRIREELLMYIDRLSKHKITCSNHNNFIKLDTLDIHKVFQTDFKQYGRIYGGFWQHAITSEERSLIKIDNQETIELDYRNQMIKILYSLESMDHQEDSYDIPGVDRKLVKQAVICMINCDSKKETIRAIQGAINKDDYLYKYWINNRINIPNLLTNLEFKHNCIFQYFYNSSGATCQRIDSEIASRVINHFVNNSKCLLGIHDSFVCKIEDKQMLFDIMHQKFEEVLQIEIQDPISLIN